MGAQMARSPALGVIRFRTKLKAENPTTTHMSQREARGHKATSPARANTMTARLTRSAAWTSAVIRSSPGSQISANLVYSSAQVAQTLGRPLSGGTANVTVNLLDPGQKYRDRINLVDLRFAKVIEFGRRRLNVGVDVFNALNSNVVLNSNNTYGTAWLTPTLVQVARQIQLSAKFDF